jgi:hypothetical protein
VERDRDRDRDHDSQLNSVVVGYNLRIFTLEIGGDI